MKDEESRALDDAFLAVVADWSRGGEGCSEARFDQLARATFAYQIARNEPYARFAAASGFAVAPIFAAALSVTAAPGAAAPRFAPASAVAAGRVPATWREIPAVPASAFKDATLATFDVCGAELEFHSSGTTAERSSKHYIERAALYDAALTAGFDRFMLGDGARLRYLNLVPDPRRKRHSSLGYMMGHVSVLRGDGKAAYFFDDDRLDVAGFTRALGAACAEGRPVCVAGTAFAFAALLEALESSTTRFAAPPGSRIMETGGFKGRARVVERDELYARLSETLGIAPEAIVAEYGMTELVSQYYDTPASRSGSGPRIKGSPPWLRTLVVSGDGREVPDGETGFLRHVDLGNRSSVIAIDTEDRGYRAGDGIVLLGRESDAPPRGCSLDAEDLLAGEMRSAAIPR